MMRSQSHFVRAASPFAGAIQAGPLARIGGAQYSAGVAETTAHRIGVRERYRRTAASVRFFYVRCLCASFNGRALAGVPSGTPVSCIAGTPTLLRARPPQLALTGRDIRTDTGGRTMRQLTHAYSGQNPALIQSIIRDALRAAATADTYQSALDATGAALVVISALVRAEVRNG